MIAQVSENPELSPVFEDIFDADGASINVVPISDYIEIGANVAYGKLVTAAIARGESAIGYYTHKRGASASAVTLNPVKTTEITAAEGDGLIVIGDLR
jgi:hypothetical protein